MTAPAITVVGSVNLDLVATSERLPLAGETVMGETFARYPGGKGANQALAAQRLGGQVSLIAGVGQDAEADLALSHLKSGGVDLTGCKHMQDVSTGVALIVVSKQGENQIAVVPGANAELRAEDLPQRIDTALIGQLETPLETLYAAVMRCTGFVALNLAPARGVSDDLLKRANLLIVNEIEARIYTSERLFRSKTYVAMTLGARGAILYKHGQEVARIASPQVPVMDTTGAGDTFVSALTLGLLEGRAEPDALAFACAAGAASTLRAGAQSALPTRLEVEDLMRRDTPKA